MIPKIIHYCWLSNDPVPKRLQQCMRTWNIKLPDYEIMLWDLNRFDISTSVWVKEAFENKKYAFAADYIRLYAVYHYGGIYLDMDVEVVKSFSDLLEGKTILGWEKAKGLEAGIFGGEKGAEWLKECLDYYKDRHFILPDGGFDMKILPYIMYDVLYDKYIKTEKFRVYNNEYFTAKSYETLEINKTKNTYSIHHFAGSWLPANVLSFRERFKRECYKRIGYKNTNRLIMILRYLRKK